MSKRKRTQRSRRPSNKDTTALASSAITKRVNPSRRIHKQTAPVRSSPRRVNLRSAAQAPQPSPSHYQYTPLNDDLKEIRLLTLHEGDFKSDIHISIHTVPLTPDNPPTYEALSYVWGSLDDPIDIHVGLQTLPVTQNLAGALPYLRYRDKPRTLWIDAICVNQQDLKERSRQVRRMADLYRLADRVVVWLGPEKKDSKYGLRLLGELSSKITVNWLLLTMEPVSNGAEKHWADRNENLPYGDKELHAICSLISCPWFERLWIWQEIRLAKSNAIMICGYDTIHWESFRTALFCLNSKTYRTKQTSVIFEQFLARALKTFPLTNSESNFTFLDIMHDTRHCEYIDPKDRVYAILSLLELSGEAIDIEPDYTKRTAQVYQDVTLRYINRHKRLDILTSSGLKERPSKMPTWVPDWTIVDTPEPIRSEFASGDTGMGVQYRGTGILSVTGSVSATVQHVDRIECRYYTSLIAEIQRLAPHDVLRGSYIGSGSLLTAYCNTLCANAFSDTYLPPPENLPKSQQSRDFLSAILQPSIKQVPDYSRGTQAGMFTERIWDYCKGSTFVKTREGYIGLAPRYAQPGDQVCVLLGCNVPMLLRPIANSQYQVVGECYVHGLMNGEAFLGLLPEDFQPTFIFNEPSRRDFWGFLDHRTGKTQYNDPRMESLPEDDNDKKTPMLSWPDGTLTRRLTREMIERRGVKLQTFDLI